jgi:hypothetical protein
LPPLQQQQQLKVDAPAFVPAQVTVQQQAQLKVGAPAFVPGQQNL